MTYKFSGRISGALVALVLVVVSALAQAGPLMERIEQGEPIRLGFAAEPPFAYPGDDGEPLGFANAIAVGVLEKLGYTDLEPVLTDWGGMIPGLVAGRVDIVTGGMYILGSRCANMNFSDPIGRFGDAFIVSKGNPQEIHNYEDIREKSAIMVTGAGYNTIEAAKKFDVPEKNIMQVPGATEILAAVKSGRADAGALPNLEAQRLASHASDEIEATDPDALPEWTFNWIGLGFRPADDDFRQKFNAALADYIGSDEMMQTVAKFEYTPKNLPGDQDTEWVCKHR